MSGLMNLKMLSGACLVGALESHAMNMRRRPTEQIEQIQGDDEVHDDQAEVANVVPTVLSDRLSNLRPPSLSLSKDSKDSCPSGLGLKFKDSLNDLRTRFQEGDEVDYYSTTNGRWVQAKVVKVTETQLDLDVRTAADVFRVKERTVKPQSPVKPKSPAKPSKFWEAELKRRWENLQKEKREYAQKVRRELDMPELGMPTKKENKERRVRFRQDPSSSPSMID
jgi:hypothetical protein